MNVLQYNFYFILGTISVNFTSHSEIKKRIQQKGSCSHKHFLSLSLSPETYQIVIFQHMLPDGRRICPRYEVLHISVKKFPKGERLT